MAIYSLTPNEIKSKTQKNINTIFHYDDFVFKKGIYNSNLTQLTIYKIERMHYFITELLLEVMIYDNKNNSWGCSTNQSIYLDLV